MADNIMNDNAKDNNADNNVIEFDSKVTEKDLLRFKFYHKYHTIRYGRDNSGPDNDSSLCYINRQG